MPRLSRKARRERAVRAIDDALKGVEFVDKMELLTGYLSAQIGSIPDQQARSAVLAKVVAQISEEMQAAAWLEGGDEMLDDAIDTTEAVAELESGATTH
jgi:hypothetical protein